MYEHKDGYCDKCHRKLEHCICNVFDKNDEESYFDSEYEFDDYEIEPDYDEYNKSPKKTDCKPKHDDCKPPKDDFKPKHDDCKPPKHDDCKPPKHDDCKPPKDDCKPKDDCEKPCPPKKDECCKPTPPPPKKPCRPPCPPMYKDYNRRNPCKNWQDRYYYGRCPIVEENLCDLECFIPLIAIVAMLLCSNSFSEHNIQLILLFSLIYLIII